MDLIDRQAVIDILCDDDLRKIERIRNLPNIPIIESIKSKIDEGYCQVGSEYDQGRNYGLYMANEIIDSLTQ